MTADDRIPDAWLIAGSRALHDTECDETCSVPTQPCFHRARAVLAAVVPLVEAALTAQLQTVRELHRAMPPLSNPDPTLNCYSCDDPYPCPTILALLTPTDKDGGK